MALTGRPQEVVADDYVGAILYSNSDDCQVWQLTKSLDKMAEKPNYEVLYVRDEEDLREELEQRNDAPAGFTFVSLSDTSNHRYHSTAYQVEVSAILYAHPETDSELVYKEARLRGAVRVPNHPELNDSKYDPSTTGYSLLDDEFYWDGDTLKCDPKKIKRLKGSRKGVKTRQLREGLLKVTDLIGMCSHIAAVIADNVEGLCYFYNWRAGPGQTGGSRYGTTVFTYEGPNTYTGRPGICSAIQAHVKLADTLRVGSKLRKDKRYRSWVRRTRPYIAGMQKNDDMRILGETLEAECIKMKLKLPPELEKKAQASPADNKSEQA